MVWVSARSRAAISRWKAREVVVALLVARCAPETRLPGEPGERDVDVVRRPAEHPDAVSGELPEAPVASVQIVAARGDEVADAGDVAVVDQAVVGVHLLPVEVAGHPRE